VPLLLIVDEPAVEVSLNDIVAVVALVICALPAGCRCW
jgi:hypothetical protein